MKPGNLFIQGAKSGGKRKMRISILTHIESSVCGFSFSDSVTERKEKQNGKKTFYL